MCAWYFVRHLPDNFSLQAPLSLKNSLQELCRHNKRPASRRLHRPLCGALVRCKRVTKSTKIDIGQRKERPPPLCFDRGQRFSPWRLKLDRVGAPKTGWCCCLMMSAGLCRQLGFGSGSHSWCHWLGQGRGLWGCLLSVVEADGRVEQDPSESHRPVLRQD